MNAKLLFLLQISTLFQAIPTCSGSPKKATKRPPLIVVGFDGVGWQFLSDNPNTDTPHFDFIAKTGVKAKNMLTVNPTRTFPTFTTLVTGLYPESHGIVDNIFYDPVFNESFYLETDCSNFDPKFYDMSEPIWLTMEKRGRKTGTYFWPSTTSYRRRPSYFANHICKINCSEWEGRRVELRKKHWRNHCKFDWYNDPHWHRIETMMKWLKSDDPPEFILLYFEQPDYDGHKYGPDHPYYRQSMSTEDRYTIAKLLRELKKADMLDKVDMIFVSDHSMVEINSEQEVPVFNYTDIDLAKWLGYNGMWVKPGDVEELYRNFTRVDIPHIKVYKREDVPLEYHSRHNRRYPPLFVDIDEGWRVRYDYYEKGSKKPWSRGDHGWAPTEETASLFYARGPSFKVGYNSTKTLRAVDLYPLMCHLLGLEPLPNNGSLDNMREFLRDPEPSPKPSHADATIVNAMLLVATLIVNTLLKNDV